MATKNNKEVISNGSKKSWNNTFPKFLINPASWFAVGAMLNPVLKEANNTKKSKPPDLQHSNKLNFLNH